MVNGAIISGDFFATVYFQSSNSFFLQCILAIYPTHWHCALCHSSKCCLAQFGFGLGLMQPPSPPMEFLNFPMVFLLFTPHHHHHPRIQFSLSFMRFCWLLPRLLRKYLCCLKCCSLDLYGVGVNASVGVVQLPRLRFVQNSLHTFLFMAICGPKSVPTKPSSGEMVCHLVRLSTVNYKLGINTVAYRSWAIFICHCFLKIAHKTVALRIFMQQ